MVRLFCLVATAFALRAEPITPSVTFRRGPVNEIVISRAGSRLAVYAGRGERVLYTHARRDALRPVPGAQAFVPTAEADLFGDPQKFWSAFAQDRFHDYEVRSSKWPVKPVSTNIKAVHGGERFTWRGLDFDVVDTPGFTAGAVSYVTTIDGVKLAFTGDLIYGDGHLLDIYSLQTAVPDAKTRGYHGYGARAGALIASLKKIKALQPKLLIPARGPVIRQPAAAIDKLITRLEALFQEHFSTDALRWYWGDDNLRLRAGKILGTTKPLAWMEMSEQRKLPDWVVPIQNSRLLLSNTGAGYLIDCGNARILAEVQKRAPKVEGIFITHYHDDHTDHAQKAADTFGVKVHASPELAGVLRNPRAYRLPAMTANPITSLEVMQEGKRIRWHEFEFTYLFYPGQTLYHGGLLVKKDGENEPLFFVGDTFTPSGLDDYCLQNRNLLDEDQGYLYCLRELRAMSAQPWLINEHVEPMFRFAPTQLDRMETSLRQRNAILRELVPFDHPNYGVDEQWAWFEPYEVTAKPGATVEIKLRLTNHSGVAKTFRVDRQKVKVPPKSSRSVPVRVQVPRDARDWWIATATIAMGDLKLQDWAEAMVRVER